MNPLMLMSLLSAGGTLGGFLFPDRSRTKFMQELYNYTSPEAINQSTQSIFGNWLKSPAFAGSRNAINASANSIATSAATGVGRAGLSNTGVGNLVRALGSNTAGLQLGNLLTQGWQNAGDAARQLALGRFQGTWGLGTQRNTPSDIYGGLMGTLGDVARIYAINKGQGTGQTSTNLGQNWNYMPNWMGPMSGPGSINWGMPGAGYTNPTIIDFAQLLGFPRQ